MTHIRFENVVAELAGEVCRSDTEQWFFFNPRQEREARGGRPSRTTGSGYWKATGSPSYVYSSDNRVIGVKKTMVFYNGKAPAGRKTKWKMHEYRAIEMESTDLNTNTNNTAVPKVCNSSLCFFIVQLVRPIIKSNDIKKKKRRDQSIDKKKMSVLISFAPVLYLIS